MSPQSKTILKSLTFLLLFTISVRVLAVWTNPTGTPPANNTEPPINTSLTGQKKDGALVAGALRADTTLVAVENALIGSLDLPNTSSVLELRSNTKGFLPPRMTMTQRDAITTPAAGLLIYQTDNAPGFYYFDGTNWLSIGSGGGNGGGGGGIGGSGTPNSVAKWTAAGTLGDANITDNGVLVSSKIDFRIGKSLFVTSQDLMVDKNSSADLDFGSTIVNFINTSSSNPFTIIKCFKAPSGSSQHGDTLYVTNVGSVTFTLKNMDASCTADNGLQTAHSEDLSLLPNRSIMLMYDIGFHRWRQVAGPN